MEYIFYHKRKYSKFLKCGIKIEGYKDILLMAEQYTQSSDIYTITNGVLLLSGRSITNIMNNGGKCIEYCIGETNDICIKASDFIKNTLENQNENRFIQNTNIITSSLFNGVARNICELRKIYTSIHGEIHKERTRTEVSHTAKILNHIYLDLETPLIYHKYYIHESK